MVMNARRKTPNETYWQCIYENIVLNYKTIQNISEISSDKVLTVNNQSLKTNFNTELNKMCDFLGIPFQEKITPSTYKKKYEYSKKLDTLYKEKDFN